MVSIVQKFLQRIEYYLRKTYAEKPFELETPNFNEEKDDIMKLQYNAGREEDQSPGLSPVRKPVLPADWFF